MLLPLSHMTSMHLSIDYFLHKSVIKNNLTVSSYVSPDIDSGGPVLSVREGYLQAVDSETLMYLARSHELFVRLRVKPGDFIERGQPLVEIWPSESVHAAAVQLPESRGRVASKDFGEDFSAKVNDTFIVGQRRTPRQDAECALDELVEVAVRALSPGINDPFTAIACLDRIAASLGRLAERKIPNPLRHDEDGVPRVLARPTTFDDVMNTAFNQIRQHGCHCVAVAIRMLIALRQIASHTIDQERKSTIRRHANMLERDFRRHIDQTEDGDDFQRRYDELIETL